MTFPLAAIDRLDGLPVRFSVCTGVPRLPSGLIGKTTSTDCRSAFAAYRNLPSGEIVIPSPNKVEPFEGKLATKLRAHVEESILNRAISLVPLSLAYKWFVPGAIAING